jgi:multicomponent Na+:H+ antiporter subunit C
MSAATLAGLTSAALVGLGLYGLLTAPHPLRKILAFNILGSGVFLLFGIIARKVAAAGFAADPVPQAMVITGIVVASRPPALAVALCCGFSRKPADHAQPRCPGEDNDTEPMPDAGDGARPRDHGAGTCSCWPSSFLSSACFFLCWRAAAMPNASLSP